MEIKQSVGRIFHKILLKNNIIKQSLKTNIEYEFCWQAVYPFAVSCEIMDPVRRCICTGSAN